MGCWNETCGLTNLPIHAGEDVMVFLVRKNILRNVGVCTSIDGDYSPFCLPFAAKYNDYGGFEDVANEIEVLLDVKKHKFYHKTEGKNKEEAINSNQGSYFIEQKITKLNEYKEVEINSISDLENIYKQETCIEINGTIYDMAIWMCHKDAFDLVVNSVGLRRVYDNSMTLYDYLNQYIPKLLIKSKTIVAKMKRDYSKYGDMLNEYFYLQFSCIDEEQLNICNINLNYNIVKEYMKDMLNYNHFEYVDRIIGIICFVNALDLLRMGFFNHSGGGSQGSEFILHEILSKWKLNFIRSKKSEWLEECDYGDEGNFGFEKIFMFGHDKSLID